MRQSVQQVQTDLQLAPKGLSRWPGAATRIKTGTRKGEIEFLNGVVMHVTELSLSIETASNQPGQKFIKLLGDSYIHVCPGCGVTVPGHVTYRRPPETRPFCPYCGPGFLLRMLTRGEKVRVHHRVDLKGGWAQWYGEKWKW